MRVCFTGHRPDKCGGYDEENPIATYVKTELLGEILTAYAEASNGIEFIVGGAIGVDMWAGEIVADMKSTLPDQNIKLSLYRPFEGQEKKWNKETQRRYWELANQCDEIVTVCEGEYAPWKMQKRNEAMVNNADLVIAVWDGTKGGTGNCVAYAKKKGKDMVFVDPTKYKEGS